MRASMPISMWAAICRSPRSEWVMGHTIRRTRGEARKAYLESGVPEYQKKALKHVGFARVVVALKAQPPSSAGSRPAATFGHAECGQPQTEPS